MNTKIKEPRIWANVFILIAGLFPFLKVTIEIESEYFSFIEGSTVSVSGYGGMGYSGIDLLIFIIPVALIVMELVRQPPIKKRVRI